MVLNSVNFCLSEKLFISPSILSEILAMYSNLGCRFFPFSTLNISCHSLLVCRVSAERSAVKCMGFPLYVTCCFSLAAFNILSLCLFFVHLISMCLGLFPLGFILYGTLRASWTWLTISFPMLGKFSTIISSKVFSSPFFFSSSSSAPIIWMFLHLILSQRSLRLSSVLFNFLLYSALQKLFPPSCLLAHWFFFWFRYSAIDSFESIFNFSNCVTCLCMVIL